MIELQYKGYLHDLILTSFQTSLLQYFESLMDALDLWLFATQDSGMGSLIQTTEFHLGSSSFITKVYVPYGLIQAIKYI